VKKKISIFKRRCYNKIKGSSMKKIIIPIVMAVASSLFANETTLFKDSTYTFKEKNFNDLIELGEYLAQESFSKEDKKNLKDWAIEDVKSSPKASKVFYKSLAETIIPTIQNSQTKPLYRVELYKKFVDMFHQHPDYNDSPHNFLAIVNHYNPPKKELQRVEILQNNLLLQTMQQNQSNFNAVLQTQQVFPQAYLPSSSRA
jgi:hypothetical protein